MKIEPSDDPTAPAETASSGSDLAIILPIVGGVILLALIAFFVYRATRAR